MLKQLADEDMKNVLTRHKKYYDKKGRFELRFAVGNFPFVDHALLKMSLSKRMAAESYKEMMPRRPGPYRILSFYPE